ncbi:hypothetical protein QTP70_012201 [Hemibagrus guttatus]|uniref:F-box only protein n=1 Tax=Hemibagrus guttatus TaxID=175788 RepID=A0AAE0VF36_9TELE|nr:hypothetical protein QTP70_012201 [Hemibagrus guttatus]
MRTGIQAASIPLVGGTFQRSSCRGVVSAESRGLGEGPLRLQWAVRRQRIQADRRRCPHPSYRVGQKVWLSTRNLRLKLPCRKLSPRFIGPFEIICQVNPVAYRLRLLATYRICPTFHVSLLKPAHPSTEGAPAGGVPPSPLDVEGSPAYRVQALLDSRRVRSRVQYLVDWEGYGTEEWSWVDALDILDPSLTEDFHRDHSNKPAPHPRGRVIHVIRIFISNLPALFALQLELSAFRAKWMSELRPGSGIKTGLSKAADLKKKQELVREEKARELFLKAVEEEQNGAVYEAIKYYKSAMQLVPDIEFKINYSRSPDPDRVGGSYLEQNENDGEIVDLLAYLQQQLTVEHSSQKICQPEVETSQVHISALPLEVLMYIFRWVVSSDLDMRALEQLSLVCRGFYICARDPEIWRSACLRVWGRSCTKMLPFSSWRNMFLERPRVRFDGVYISKTSYIRQGEESLDGFYRAWHQVDYYRYLRFFPDGQVMMLTTPEEPPATVPRLRSKNTRMDSIMIGHYRLSQDTDNQTKVYVVVSKRKDEKVPEYQRSRFCRRYPAPESERSFHVGLQLSSGGLQRFNKLVWIHHSCHIMYRSTGETVITAFDLDKMYTPLYFARVKSYTSFSERPL